MTHFIKVSIVIVLVTIVFFNSSVIENIVDPSYNEYDYLRKIRRTHNVVESDTEDKGWQDDGTFKSWYQKGNGSENDKHLNNITPTPLVSTSIDSKESPHITNIRLNQPINHVDSNVTQNQYEPDSSNTTNILPYALLLLLIIIISIIVYVKYH
jgi:hypothetical protein